MTDVFGGLKLCLQPAACRRGKECEKSMEKTATILMADDDPDIAELVELHLVSEGFRVFKAYDGREALQVFAREHIDLAILDIMMPKLDGIHVCEKIREISTIPVIMLSAKDSEADKVSGLGIGADDYVTKPFHTGELAARVKSQLRRYQRFGVQDRAERTDVVKLENLYMEKESHKVQAYGRDVRLTPLEFDILYLLASNPGKVFSTDEIFEKVWKEKSFEMSNTVMVHIRRLREKLTGGSRERQIIKTVWGVGYKIEA